MGEPPRDEDGFVTPHNDRQSIPDDALLLRSLPDDWVITDDGGERASSAAFCPSSVDHDRYQSISVTVVDSLVRAGKNEKDGIKDGHSAAAILRAGDMRDLGYDIGPDPTDNDPWHACIWGAKKNDKRRISKKVIRLLKRE